MKRWLPVFLLVFIWGMPLVKAEPVSLQVTDGDVRAVLTSAARMGGVGLVLDDSVKGKITLQLEAMRRDGSTRCGVPFAGAITRRSGNARTRLPALPQ